MYRGGIIKCTLYIKGGYIRLPFIPGGGYNAGGWEVH